MRIRCKNFQFHEELDLEIPYSGDPTKIAVSGDSGSGKTTIFRAIDHCLYGRRLAKEDRKETWVEMSTDVLGESLRIRRQRNPGRLQVWVEEEEYEGEAAQSIITEFFPDADIFAACCYIQQDLRCGLLSAPPEAQIRYLTRLAFRDEDPDRLISKISSEKKRVKRECETRIAAYEASTRTFEKLANGIEILEVTAEEVEAKALELKDLRREKRELTGQLEENAQNAGKQQTWEKELTELEVPDPVDPTEIKKLSEDLEQMRKELEWYRSRQRLHQSLAELSIPDPVDPEKLADQEDRLQQLRTISQQFRQRQTLEARLQKTGALIPEEPPRRSPEERARLRKEVFAFETGKRTCAEFEVEFTSDAIAEFLQDLKDSLRKAEKWQKFHSEFQKLESRKKKLRNQSCTEARQRLEEISLQITTTEEYAKKKKEWDQVQALRKQLTAESFEESRSALAIAEKKLEKAQGQLAVLESACGDLECPECHTVLALVEGQLQSAAQRPSEEQLQKVRKSLAVARKEKVTANKEVQLWEQIQQFSVPEEPIPPELKVSNLAAARSEKVALEKEIWTWQEIEKVDLGPRPEKFELDDETEELAEAAIGALSRLRVVSDPGISSDALDAEVKLRDRWEKQQEILGEMEDFPEVEDPTIELKNLEKSVPQLRKDLKKYQEGVQKQEMLENQLSEISEGQDTSKAIPITEQQLRQLREQNSQHRSSSQRQQELRKNLTELTFHSVENTDLKKLERKIRVAEKWIRDAEMSVKLLEQEAELEEEDQEIEKMEEQLLDLEKLYEVAFNLKFTIIEAALNTLDVTTNTLLESFFREPIQVSLDMFRKTKTTDALKRGFHIAVHFRGRETTVAELSGGEKDRVSLALALALASMSNAPLMMIDESLGSSDTELKTQCLEAIGNITSVGQILIVAHDFNESDFDACIHLK